ncbi:hypothetical protein PybrP1_000553 [[Pythium] brassicae (nom. inval.)]|nr:hypothetical protein PybrP1_000553 [[Pythium] brassicae (nom. inval.)]
MWGVAGGAVLVAAGVALVAHGSRSLDAARARESALLFSSAHIRDDGSGAFSPPFVASAAFTAAMDAPVYASFYVFNLTNSARVLRGSEPPSVQQLGPFVYEKRSRKVNVQFHAAPLTSSTTSPSAADAALAAAFGHVSYQIVSSFVFAPERSNGSDADVVVTVNATYARRLQKLRARGYSERFLLAEFAQQHMRAYTRHLREDFLADAKLRAWTHFVPALVAHATREVLPAVLALQRQRVDAASIPANLVRAFAVARTEMIPRVLGGVYKDISSQFLPEILQTNLDAARRHALPRVLSNLHRRLTVESVPYWLQQQLRRQQLVQVPITLASLKPKLEATALPYVLKEVYDRSCLEAVPGILRSIKAEIVARDIAGNRATADAAQRSVVELWRKQGSAATDFDAWFDDAPLGKPRTGFELLPASTSLQLSLEAASLILGSVVSNKRFSIVDYDSAAAATYPLDEPPVTPVGFAIWKQVIAMNETAIAYVLQGVNDDVALPDDYLTRAQLLFIRQYLVEWASSTVTQRDRERFWRQSFARRSANSDQNEPSVDLDIEKSGVQSGFALRAGGSSSSGVTAAIALQMWNSSSEVSFVNPQGFTTWQSANGGSASSVQTLKDRIPGLTSAQISEVSAWIQALLRDGFVWRRAMRHWSDGTCQSVLKLPMSPCLLYDLEPGTAGNQTGFEMNPQSKEDAKVSPAARELLWDRSKSPSFLVLWEPLNPVSFVHLDGYRRWFTTKRCGRMSLAHLDKTGSTIDLDNSTSGVQGGFELFPNGEWKKIAGDKLPTFDQGQYLWRAANTFSFLKTDGGLTISGLPAGFSAWKEVYDGVDFSSEQLVPIYPAEARAFCDLNDQDLVFAYDVRTECKLNAEYAVAPFNSKDECEFLMTNIAAAYELPASQQQQACSSQAYLRYAAARFVYEPSVLGLNASEFVSKATPADPNTLQYPIGGTPEQCRGMWKNDSIEDGQVAELFVTAPPPMLTLQVPLLNKSTLFQKKSRVVGEILAIDNATELSVWGTKVALSAARVTDGSQFATAVLSAKYSNGGKDFPPAKLLFYWVYARRFVEATYARNITRFGIPLMRYTISSWLNPTSLPSGLAKTSIDVDPLTGSVYHSRFVWQMNALVTRDVVRDEWHKRMLECWLPVVWVQEQSSVTAANGLSLAASAKPGPFAREKVARHFDGGNDDDKLARLRHRDASGASDTPCLSDSPPDGGDGDGDGDRDSRGKQQLLHTSPPGSRRGGGGRKQSSLPAVIQSIVEQTDDIEGNVQESHVAQV